MVAAVVVFVLIIAGMFVFAFLKKSEINEVAPTVTPPSTTEAGPYDHITRIDAKHFFIDGTHTLAGEIILPTRCDLLDWSTQVAESMPEMVTVDFTVINNEQNCEPSLEPARFVVPIVASEQAQFKATLMGREVILNLIPSAPGETPDQYVPYSKG